MEKLKQKAVEQHRIIEFRRWEGFVEQNRCVLSLEWKRIQYNTINKKDGYRQQNVRQRQKLISINGRICSHFGDIQRQKMAWPWNLGMRSFKVIEKGAVR